MYSIFFCRPQIKNNIFFKKTSGFKCFSKHDLPYGLVYEQMTFCMYKKQDAN